MPYNDIFTNDVYQNEHDEDMTRKHPNYYKAIKSFFPEVYKLPEDEITPMIGILKNQGDTYDEAASLVKDYINQKKPVWNQNYFDTGKSNNFNHEQGAGLYPMSDSQRIEAYKLARQIRPKNITISDQDYNFARSPWARKAAFIYQGMADGTNDLTGGLAEKFIGEDIHPVEAENLLEKELEKKSKMLYNKLAKKMIFG